MTPAELPLIDRIVRSRRRTLGLQVTRDAQVVVRAPHRASMEEIKRWVERNLAWIRKHQERLRAAAAQHPPLSPDERAQRETLARAAAQSLLPERAALMATAAGLTYTSLRISSARTRWGSCSRQGRLNFSWRLALAPVPIIDYVVAHELAHLVHPNHSRRFWKKVEELYPDFRSARAWLRKNAARLDG